MTEHPIQVIEYYNKINNYELAALTDPIYSELIFQAVEIISKSNCTSLLDIGCATSWLGRISTGNKELIKQTLDLFSTIEKIRKQIVFDKLSLLEISNYVGVDINDSFINEAKKTLKGSNSGKMNFECDSINNYNVNSKFEIICLLGVLNWVENWKSLKFWKQFKLLGKSKFIICLEINNEKKPKWDLPQGYFLFKDKDLQYLDKKLDINKKLIIGNWILISGKLKLVNDFGGEDRK